MVLPAANFSTSSTKGSMSPSSNCSEPPHQIAFMREFEKQGGVAFIILSFTSQGEIYYVPFDVIAGFWKRMEDGGRKSFTYEEAAAKAWKIRSCRDMLVHYLEELQLDLDRKEALEQGGTP